MVTLFDSMISPRFCKAIASSTRAAQLRRRSRFFSAPATFAETSSNSAIPSDETPQHTSSNRRGDPNRLRKPQPNRRMEDNHVRHQAMPEEPPSPSLRLKDERLPCAQHLDPQGNVLPTSDWIHVNGTLPICSVNEVLRSMEKLLREEEFRGIIDLDAEWNPVEDSSVPTLTLDNDVASLIQAAHVVISPFGRPNGWHIKLANRSLANAILTRSQEEHIRVAWKVVQIQEYMYSKNRQKEEDPALANGLVVDDSMVRIESCPHTLKNEYVRYILSRYDLAPEGNTIIQWKGKTNDGKVAPLMFVVRFADPSWARAAVRELQSTVVNGKVVRLVQYPKQKRYIE